jgi:hypothetical protein
MPVSQSTGSVARVRNEKRQRTAAVQDAGAHANVLGFWRGDRAAADSLIRLTPESTRGGSSFAGSRFPFAKGIGLFTFPADMVNRCHIILTCSVLIGVSSLRCGAEMDAEQLAFFENKIRPVLVEYCYECHSTKAATVKADLYLDNRDAAMKGSESGVVIVSGDPEKSILIRAVKYLEESLEMPPAGKLSAAVIADLEKWVIMGAPWPDDGASEVVNRGTTIDFEKFRREHWSFKPIVKPPLPVIANPQWAQQPIDVFVHAKLATVGMYPSAPAARRTLIRRAYFDLLGLPPTADQVSEFVSGKKSWAMVIEQLLRSSHYGERWGRHWLDVARYSDGLGGFLDSGALPEAWRYRDWVVAALNHDMPYDEFIRRQIAGDLLADPKQHAVGTGFFAVGPTYRSDGGDPEAKAQALAETLSDRVDTLSRAILGLTVACARCHDHKFDPISARDYYAMAGVFKNTNLREFPLAEQDVVKAYQAHQKEIRDLENDLKKLKSEVKKAGRKLTTDELDQEKVWKKQVAELKESAPDKYEFVHSLGDIGAADMNLAIRGDLRKPGEVVSRRFLEIVGGADQKDFGDGSGRKELAEAVVDPKNPLTARVFVNRVWQWHFGRALVRTPSNFGILGEKPTHPQLLDWLANRFVEDGWSVKNLHRIIMNSATYQMSSQFNRFNFERDGDNRNIWRMNPRRLEVEAWRDSLLHVAGKLNRSIGGAPDGEILESDRRTLYATISRNGDRFRSEEFLRTFDFPAARSSASARTVSTVPQQYLFMMNSKFMADCAEHLARRILESGPEPYGRIRFAYRSLFQREPEEFEKIAGYGFLRTSGGGDELDTFKRYARTLLSSEEFRYIE